MFYREKKLKNGLRIVLIPLNHRHSVFLSMFIKSGSRFENKKTNGLGHLLEHVLVRGPKKELSQIAGDLEASTFQGYTYYQLNIMPQYLKHGVSILSDILQKPNLKKQTIKAEKNIIQEEILSYQNEKNQDIDLDELTNSLLWPKTNLSLKVLGKIKQVKKFNKKDLLKYWQKFYVPNNMVLCAVGKLDPNKCMGLIEKSFNSWQAGKTAKIITVKAKQTKSKYCFVQNSSSQIEARLAFPTFSYNNPTYEILNLLNTIVDIRVKKQICSEQGLVYNIYSDFTTFSDNGFLNIDFSISSEKLIKTLKKIIKLIKRKITKNELVQAKMINKRDLMLDIDDPRAIANIFGRDKLLGCFNAPEQTLKDIKKITLNNVQKLAQKIFIPEKSNLIIIGDYKKTKRQK